MATLHIHADESGCFNFGRSGSTHYAFAVAWTRDPQPLARRLTELRFRFLRQGKNIPQFHAGPDELGTRDTVIRELVKEDAWSFCATVVRKDRVWSHLRDPRRFYPRFLEMPLRFVLRGRVGGDVDRILVYTDRLPHMKRKKGVEKAIKTTLASEVTPPIPFHIFHHPSASNKWLQVADYCCWSVYRKHEHNDPTYYDMLRPRLAEPELVLWR